MHGAGDLAAGLHLRGIAHVDNKRIAISDDLARLVGGNFRHRGIGGFEHLFDICGHGDLRRHALGALPETLLRYPHPIQSLDKITFLTSG
jgi:hypothetical protein